MEYVSPRDAYDLYDASVVKYRLRKLTTFIAKTLHHIHSSRVASVLGTTTLCKSHICGRNV